MLRYDSNGNRSNDPALPAVDLQYLASDAWMTTMADGSQTAIENAALDWALSPWDSPPGPQRPDAAADPKVKVTLNVYQVDDAVYSANQINGEVSAAKSYWWNKAKMQLDWNSAIALIPGCNRDLHPNGCTEQVDLLKVSSVPQYAEIHDAVGAVKGVNLVFTGLLYRCYACGAPDDVLGITPFNYGAEKYEPTAMISALAPWEVVAHELGHTFQLPHYTTTDGLSSINPADYWYGLEYIVQGILRAKNNLMCGPDPSGTTIYCPNTPHTDLTEDQISKAVRGAVERQ